MKSGNVARLGSRWIVLSALLFLASSASAHHATALEYDASKAATLKGTITRMDWANPHIHVFMQIKSERGVAEEWDVEFPSPGGTIVAGLSKEKLANGVVLTFEGYLSRPDFRPNPRKNSSQGGQPATPDHFACATGITLSNGDHFTFIVGI
jgi:hypothetical protein